MPAVKTAEATETVFTPPMPEREANLPATQTTALPATAQPTTMLDIIDRASRDPSVDIDKLERLIGMKERMEAHLARVEYDNAMAAAQAEMEPIRANMANSQTKSQYADQAALDRAIRPIYTKHGFSLSYGMGDSAPADHVRLVCKVAHRGGHREYPHIDMPADGKGAKGGDVMTKTHATGAASTYGKRYLESMIFNLAIARDDDGNGASGEDEYEGLGTGPRDPDTGKLLSHYSAAKANKAKDAADNAIQLLNTLNAEQAREWRRENYKAPPKSRVSFLGWLQVHSPGQWHRVKTCYQNITGEDL